jgi:diguanylate cyclase (GGDEF)-like protein/PAS domain S-box-containing protein
MTDSTPLQRSEFRRIPPAWQLLGVALMLVCLSGSASLINARSWSEGGLTILWPSNGLLLGVLLCAPRKHWPAYLAVGLAVDFEINRLLACSVYTATYLGVCNMLEVVVAAVPLSRVISPKPDLTQRKQLIYFLLCGVILAPGIAASVAAFETARSFSLPVLHSFQEWFTADALGIATVTPLYLSFKQRDHFSGRSLTEIGSLFGLLCATTVFVFWQTQYPLLFLVMVLLLLLGVRLGLAGSALGLLIASNIGGFLTTLGHGPVALVLHRSLSVRELIFQFFIATSMLMLYIIEVMIAERNRLQQNLKESESRFRLLAEVSRDIIVLTDVSGERRYVSPAVTETLGWIPEELIGKTYEQIVHPEDQKDFAKLLDECREGKPSTTLPYRCQAKDGSFLWMEANLRLYHDSLTGEPVGFVNVVRDISHRKAAEEELTKAFRLVENLASVDGLTGIANRRRLDEALDYEWRRAIRDRADLSVLLIDVDHFKPYNDIYGHLSGDSCLREIAEAALEVVHRPADLLARYGGEEFAVVLPNTDSSGAKEIAEQIRNSVERRRAPHSGNPHGVITVSIGCATQIPDRDSDYTALLRAADSALYIAKSSGRNRIEIASLDSRMRESRS